MRKGRFTEEQIIKVLKDTLPGVGERSSASTASAMRRSQSRSRFGGMEISDAKAESLEEENHKLKKLFGDDDARRLDAEGDA